MVSNSEVVPHPVEEVGDRRPKGDKRPGFSEILCSASSCLAEWRRREPSASLYRAIGVLETLLELSGDHRSSLTRFSALATIHGVIHSGHPEQAAAELAPHYPLRIVEAYRMAAFASTISAATSNSADDPFKKVRLVSLADLLTFQRSREPVPELSIEHREAIVRHIHGEDGPRKVDTGTVVTDIAGSIRQGIGFAISVCGALFRKDLVGPDADLIQQLRDLFGERFRIHAFEVMSNLEASILSHPPGTDESLLNFVVLSALFCAQGGGVTPSRVFDDLTRALRIESETLKVLPLFDEVAVDIAESASPAIFAYKIANRCSQYAEKHDLRNIELSDLIFAVALFAHAVHRTPATDPPAVMKELRSYTGFVWRAFEERRIATYANSYDAEDLGVTLARGNQVPLVDRQLLGAIGTRAHALGTFVGREAIDSSHALLGRTGALLGQFVPIDRVSTQVRARWRVDFVEDQALHQFRANTSRSAIVRELLHSGDYPVLLEQLRLAGLSADWEVDRVEQGLVENLPLDEWLAMDFRYMRTHCPGFKTGFHNVTATLGSQRSYAIVHRGRGPISDVLIALGFDSNGTGMGVEHLQAQRPGGKRFERLVQSAGGAGRAVRSYLLQGLVPVIGESDVAVPSGRWPKTHYAIAGASPDCSDTYIAVVVAKLPAPQRLPKGAYSMITSYVLGHQGKFRDFLVRQVTDAFSNGGDRDQLNESVVEANKYLTRIGETPIPYISARQRQTMEVVDNHFPSLQLPTVATRSQRAASVAGGRAVTTTLTRHPSPRTRSPAGNGREAIWDRISRRLTCFPVIAGELLVRRDSGTLKFS